MMDCIGLLRPSVSFAFLASVSVSLQDPLALLLPCGCVIQLRIDHKRKRALRPACHNLYRAIDLRVSRSSSNCLATERTLYLWQYSALIGGERTSSCAVLHDDIIALYLLPVTTHFGIHFHKSDTAPLETCIIPAWNNLLYLRVLLPVHVIQHEHTPCLVIAD